MSDFLPNEFTIRKMELELTCYESIKPEYNAVVFVIHGMADHALRHFELGEYLNKHRLGFASMDLPGHGKSAGNPENLGAWPENGFDKINEIINFRIKEIIKKYSIPVIILGHSLGSFIALRYICKYGEEITACILSSPIAEPSSLLMMFGKTISYIVAKINGEDSKSKLLDELSFGNYNNHFKPNRTRFDWISSNEKVVDDYIADSYSGIICSSGYFSDFLKGLSVVYSQENLGKIPVNLPILIFAGSEDPVSNRGEWVKILKTKLENAEIKNIKFEIYSGMRHECMNEINNAKVYKDVISFCENSIPE